MLMVRKLQRGFASWLFLLNENVHVLFSYEIFCMEASMTISRRSTFLIHFFGKLCDVTNIFDKNDVTNIM